MAKCLYCGEPLKTFSMEFIDEIHSECNEKYQKEVNEAREEVNEAREEVNEAREEVKEDRDTQVKDALLYSNSQSNSKYSLNAYLADTTITFFNIFFFIFVALLIYISYKIGQWFGGGFGFDVFLIGLLIAIFNSGLFAIFAEIYRHLKEINNKTNHPDKD